MRARLLPSLIVLGLPALSLAQESLDDIDKMKSGSTDASMGDAAKSSIAVVNGYLSNRFSATYVDPFIGPLPTDRLPSLSDLLEANVQLKVNLGAKAFAYGDVSLVLQGAWLYYGHDGKQVSDFDNPATRPAVATNELYMSWSPAPWLNLLAGKKRVVWGSGFAFNPTDLINPPKDPTQPNFQRAGAWLARMELPFERFTVSLVGSPKVLYQENGLPYQVLQYRDFDVTQDRSFHYMLAARVYALINDADVSLMAFWSNQYNDAFRDTLRLGFSFSRYFFTDYELHIEALVQQGSPRAFPNHACLGAPGGPGCANPVTDAFISRTESSGIFPRILVGTRYMFRDESLLSIEYYYQADGYSDLEFEDTIRGLVLASKFGAIPGNTPMSGTVPVNFSFDPLRRHYLIVSYSKPKIKDDWTASLTMIAGLTDLSGMITPSVSWNALEWLTLSLSGFIPIRGIPVNQVTVDGKSYSEYSLLPFDARVLFEARAFY